MEQVKDLIHIYLSWAALFGVAMAASRIQLVRSIGVVRFSFVVVLSSLAWPRFIFTRYFL